MKENLVLIGNGMAGVRTLEEVLKLEPEKYNITVFGEEPYGNYNRIMLSPVLASEKTIDEIMLNDEQWYSDNNITLHKGIKVTEINRATQSSNSAGELLYWHAKRAEKTLMTYQLQGVLSEHTPQEREFIEERQEKQKTDKGHGPIIVCLDTSGSMQGEAEQVAKALVLEALRIAFAEDRRCYVYSFSGPQQLLQHELDLTTGGLGKLLQFLQQSFHGGTDVTQPLIEALRKQQQQGWEQADILLVSDGRFPPQPQLAARIKKAKASQQLRLHGVLLGNWRGKALAELCDPVHRFSDWGKRRVSTEY